MNNGFQGKKIKKKKYPVYERILHEIRVKRDFFAFFYE